MSFFKIIQIGLKAHSLFNQGKQAYDKAEIIKEKAENIAQKASKIYKEAGGPDTTQLGAMVGKKAGEVFNKLKKIKSQFDKE